VNQVTSASLRYPLSVLNKNSTLKRGEKKEENRRKRGGGGKKKERERGMGLGG